MNLKIATWNVNSIRVRLPIVLDWLQQNKPDLLALQETKVVDKDFPEAAFREIGYHTVFAGQPTYNGVAVVGTQPLKNPQYVFPDFGNDEKRFLSVEMCGIQFINVYVPNGAAVGTDKYDYKLKWLSRLEKILQATLKKQKKIVVLGDFNIAPTDEDVHDPKSWEGQVLVSEPEREALQKIFSLGFHDAFRLFPQTEKIYSWWDYRGFSFRRNHGLRIDLILLSDTIRNDCVSCVIDKAPRKLERPSDHTPAIAEIKV